MPFWVKGSSEESCKELEVQSFEQSKGHWLCLALASLDGMETLGIL